MKPIPALFALLPLALVLGAAQAQTAPTHDHAAMMAADAAAPAAPATVAAPAAASMPMGCPGAMMHGGTMPPGPMMHGTGAMPHGAMMHADGAKPGPGPMAGNCPMGATGAMPCGQGKGMAMTGDVDKDFAAMMVRHHQMGIRMADHEIANGKDPELKALAKKMRAAHLAEIEALEKHQ